MPRHCRIATWNLNRPKPNSTVKNSARLEQIRRIESDLWILTETHSCISIEGFTSAASIPEVGYHQAGESYATIWSRWPIVSKIQTFSPHFAVCAEVHSPLGPMIVYGSIITYAMDGVRDSSARPWERHRESIRRHRQDWLKLREQFPEHLLCVAGDFNQSLDGSGWYEDKEATLLLRDAFAAVGLRCVTDMNLRATGQLKTRASIDHICLTDARVKATAISVHAWEGVTDERIKASDHNGIFVDVAWHL